ncbi:NAD-dependent epimerase/dehydratase family protein [Specibacter sp. NPDC078709]|uniref:NAD-dependent epimerase/dehydratase family protein n=1 Tax=Specibacter sp. NPDC078709 TaxID=3154364 RepID=UPI0034143AFC
MTIALVTGCDGLVGSATAEHLHSLGYQIIGIENNSRATYFGSGGTTSIRRGPAAGPSIYLRRFDVDIRDTESIKTIFSTYGKEISAVVHTAAQPSHEWATHNRRIDWDVNATATYSLLDATIEYSPAASFIFCSTNKVYGDRVNELPLVLQDTRLDLPANHEYFAGIPESFSIDATTHSFFGVSKLAADVMVQEFGRYFGLSTAVFRCGCITGKAHAAVEAHGFMAYLAKCVREGVPYRVIGHAGKQVRDNIHASDLARAFGEYLRNPKPGKVFNMGGGRENSISVIEAVQKFEILTGNEAVLDQSSLERPRKGDHRWWISSSERFQCDYPAWGISMSIDDIAEDLLSVY